MCRSNNESWSQIENVNSQLPKATHWTYPIPAYTDAFNSDDIQRLCKHEPLCVYTTKLIRTIEL